MSGKDDQIAAVIAIIQRVRPDILLLNEFDGDYTNLALKAFLVELARTPNGIIYDHFFAPMGNEGRPSGLDINKNGQLNDWADALGFGRFPGSEGMALISRYPIDNLAARDFSRLAWQGGLPANVDSSPYFSREVLPKIRLSSKSHWDVPVLIASGRYLHILASHPTPPVFDGAENLNGLRNDAEIGFWVSYLNGNMVVDNSGTKKEFEARDFVLLGDLNNDPNAGEGLKGSLTALLEHPRIIDPIQRSQGGVISADRLGGANNSHQGDPATDTVEWDAEIGNMRVDYALPSSSLTVANSGVFWPAPDTPEGGMIKEGRDGASNHRLVWVDIVID